MALAKPATWGSKIDEICRQLSTVKADKRPQWGSFSHRGAYGDVGITDGGGRGREAESNGTLHLLPQRITEVKGKPRSCQARRPPARGERAQIPSGVTEGYTRARELMRSSSTVKDDFAIARNRRSLVAIR